MAKYKSWREIENSTAVSIPIAGRKVCPECKKVFDWYGEQWVYRDHYDGKRRFYCSYNCWRAIDRRKEAKRKEALRGGHFADA
jgi:hypothetical protein